MLKLNFVLLIAASAAALASCGGGSEQSVSPVAPIVEAVADKYVGTWHSTCTPGAGGPGGASYHDRFAFKKIDSSNLAFVFDTIVYEGNFVCSGEIKPSQFNAAGLINLNGTKKIGDAMVDKWDMFVQTSNRADISSNTSLKTVGYVTGTVLQTGVDPLGSDGYPSAIDGVDVFKKITP